MEKTLLPERLTSLREPPVEPDLVDPAAGAAGAGAGAASAGAAAGSSSFFFFFFFFSASAYTSTKRDESQILFTEQPRWPCAPQSI